MSINGNNNLQKGISQLEFNQLLNQCVFINKKTKENVASIFAKIAGADSELSAEEWRGFATGTDTNADGSISAKEEGQILKTVQDKAHTLYQQSKDAITAFFNIVKNYIAKINNPDNNRQNGSSEVLYAETNPHRKPSGTSGTFEGGWIEHDKYNSSTFEEWLTNNKYQFNEEIANELERQAQKRNGLNGKCALAFRECAQDTTVVSQDTFEILYRDQIENPKQENDDENFLNGELASNKLFNKMENQASAYQYASELASNPYFKEVPHNIVATMDLRSLPKGCVIVYDGGYKTTAGEGGPNYHEHGHIAVTDGTGKDSGGGHYNIVTGRQKTHIRVFIPIEIPEQPRTSVDQIFADDLKHPEFVDASIINKRIPM